MARGAGDRQAGDATQARHRPNQSCRRSPCVRRKVMSSPLLHDAEHWRRRAHEVATLASSAIDPRVRQTLAEIAQGYERLGELADDPNGRAALRTVDTTRHPSQI